MHDRTQKSVKWYFRSSSIHPDLVGSFNETNVPAFSLLAWPNASLIHGVTREGKQERGKENKKKKKKQKEKKRKKWKEWSTAYTECNSGRGQKKKEEGSSRSYRPTFLPFGRVPGALSRLLFSPFPVPVIIVLTFVWLFPSCHAITCRELACCTLRIPRTCPRPTQRRASVLIWP